MAVTDRRRFARGTGKGRTMDLMLTDMPMHYAGGGFPWGLLIIGGIVYFLWTKGVFDGRGRFGNGGRFGGGGYGAGYGPGQGSEGSGFGPGTGAGQGSTFGFSGPRAMFDDWHREAHETHGTSPRAQAPTAPPATAATETTASGDGEPAR
jgi:hypothetical protein